MHTNHAYFWWSLTFWLINNATALLAAAQRGGPGFDLGFMQFGVDTENGLAARKDVDFNVPFFKFRKTAEIGFGEPIARAADSSGSSEESSRSKREIEDDKSMTSEYSERKKRAPCFGTYGGTGGNGNAATEVPGVDDAEAARRRVARKAMQRARKNAARKSKSKSNGRRRRRRRQAEIENFENEIQTQSGTKKIGEHIEVAMQKVRNFFESIVETTKRFAQTVGKAITASTNSSASV